MDSGNAPGPHIDASASTPSAPATPSFPLPLLAILTACAGLFIAGVLTTSHLLKIPVPCGLRHGCATVAAHPSSQFLGLPVAIYGAAAYLTLLILWLFTPTRPPVRRLALVLAGIGTPVSAFLLYVAHFHIRALCTWCLASGVAMTLLFLLALLAVRTRRILRPVTGPTAFLLASIALSGVGVQAMMMQRAALAAPIPAERLAVLPLSDFLNSANTIGPPTAPVTVVIFADLWCPACHDALGSLATFQRKNPAAVRIVYRHMPLWDLPGHKFSGTAAALSEIAADGGKFWPFVDAVHRQRTALNADGYLQLMTSLGFDPDTVRRRMDDPADPAVARARRDRDLGLSLGIHSTPTFVVVLPGQSPVSAGPLLLTRLLNSPLVRSHLAATAVHHQVKS